MRNPGRLPPVGRTNRAHRLAHDLHVLPRLLRRPAPRYAFVNDQCTESDSPCGDLDASFLVAAKSGIFYVACDMSVTEFQNYYAVGSGATYALGAMHALWTPAAKAEPIARKAVAAASALDIYCGGEVNLVTLKARSKR